MLSFLRVAASEKAIDEIFIDDLPPRYNSMYEVLRDEFWLGITLLSWVGFIAGTLTYFTDSHPNEKFFVFNYKFK